MEPSEEINNPSTPALPNAKGRKCILSTKKLGPSRKAFLESKGITVAEYNAIGIKFLDFPIPPGFESLIFSSKNGVRAFVEQAAKSGQTLEMQKLPCFCVGEKTRAMLEAHGFKVLFSAKNARELARHIAREHHKNRILFICGNQRRDELPTLLQKQDVPLTELVTYETRLTPVKQPGSFDGILFFSPTGVESHFSCNSPGQATAYCIGPTTAAAANAYTDRYKCPGEPTVESLLLLVTNELGNKRGTEMKPDKE